MQNHARAVLACDFFVTVTLRFQLLYVSTNTDWSPRRECREARAEVIAEYTRMVATRRPG